MRELAGQESNESLRLVSDRLLREGIAHRPLTRLELLRYKDFVAGWRLSVTFPDRIREIDLLMEADWPWVPPRVALTDQMQFGVWPHVERSGLLCLLPSNAETDPYRPDDVALSVLGDAAQLIEELAAGERDLDFQDEICSYWDWHVTRNSNPIYSLLTPCPPSRTVSTWIGQTHSLVGESPEDLKRWLQNRYPSIKERNLETTNGALIWLGEPPNPSQFPKRGIDVLNLARKNGADLNNFIEPFASSTPEQLLVMFGSVGANGPGLFGVSIQRPEFVRGSDPLTRGFRNKRVPSELVATRFLQGRLSRCNAERADASWIHGRDQDPRAAILRNKKVTIIGCGSVGSAIAVLMASAGVGKLQLIDKESLKFANCGRHALGASSVGYGKASALSQDLRSRFPHITDVSYVGMEWQEEIRTNDGLFDDTDLIISATGSWSSEAMLNEWRLTNRRHITALFTWTEPHGCAGHAIALNDDGCLQCGFDNCGYPHLQVTAWPRGSTIKQEPACGAVFQPYGPVELSHITAMAAELAIDCLQSQISASTHRIWAGSERLLKNAGGEWSADWLKVAGGQFSGSHQREFAWNVSSTCQRCALGAA